MFSLCGADAWIHSHYSEYPTGLEDYEIYIIGGEFLQWKVEFYDRAEILRRGNLSKQEAIPPEALQGEDNYSSPAAQM